MQGNAYTIGFAAAICVACSLLLSGVSGALKPRQDKNRVLDRQKNILVALGWDKDNVATMTGEQVQSTYKSGVEEMVISRANGKKIEKSIKDLPAKVARGEEKTATELPLYKRVDDDSKLAFAYPVTGKGLWSTLYGYLAVKPSGNEIVGLTFYKHGETPGLGAEIEQPWFRQNFVGKELYDDGNLVGIEVVKGKAADKPSYKSNKDHMVDGISGATLTGNGVMKMTKIEPLKYAAFFKNRKSGPTAKAAPVEKPKEAPMKKDAAANPQPSDATAADAVAESAAAKNGAAPTAAKPEEKAPATSVDETAAKKQPAGNLKPNIIVVPRETDVSKKAAAGRAGKLVPAAGKSPAPKAAAPKGDAQ